MAKIPNNVVNGTNGTTMATGITYTTPIEPENLHPDDKAELDAFFAKDQDPGYVEANNVWTVDMPQKVCDKLATHIRNHLMNHVECSTEESAGVDEDVWEFLVDTFADKWVDEAKEDTRNTALEPREKAKRLYRLAWRVQFVDETQGRLVNFVRDYFRKNGLPVPRQILPQG
ncbi:MAG: hypothetical protein Q9211_000952 [Gyalolechia sp. 1 TL-2023]